MEVRYEDQKLRNLCTDEREMNRRRSDIAPKLRLRIKALERAATVGGLAAEDPGGNWHPMTADRRGVWAGKLSPNYRLLVRPEGEGLAAVTVTVIEIIDYH
ncbi:hypothetical protein MIAR_05630 [Microbacterium arabinogalactanolyticum]|uniref:Plasmid maintenance system killer protein n=2 Tax=Microbacterium arabinogalactanolyticum TaxID=69365 RepID=A0ABQ5NDU6_9MICO|nr:hypothetical protein MIAR_05630 [Microbacterium arabinogalactanolyticum]